MLDNILCFFNIKATWDHWNTSLLVIVYSTFYTLLNIINIVLVLFVSIFVRLILVKFSDDLELSLHFIMCSVKTVVLGMNS